MTCNAYQLDATHTKTGTEVLDALDSSYRGLSHKEAKRRLEVCGHNLMPRSKQPGLLAVFFRQFLSPLIYVLFAAALLSIIIQEWSDAGFIFAVLIINAIIGTVQEYSAQQAASALDKMVTTQCRVIRDGDTYQIDSEQLVPGDIILLESGDKIPADIRLLSSHELSADEAALTGESLPISKKADKQLPSDAFIGDQCNMVFAGTLVNRGKGEGVVVKTGMNTELGKIATDVLLKPVTKPPLLVRMEQFTHRVAIIVAFAAIVMAIISFIQGMALSEIFMLAVALAVSVIPEGLPVALTVALAIGMRRMANRHVIIRRLVAVEALGSCTSIATDKTGTLTVNQLTVRRIIIPDAEDWDVSGEGLEPEGVISKADERLNDNETKVLERLCVAAVLANDAFIAQRDDGWVHQGDAVDVALLVLAHKAGIIKADYDTKYPEVDCIPFESERMFTATLNQVDDRQEAFVKGATEVVLPMCSSMATASGDVSLDHTLITDTEHRLAAKGFRILALASGHTVDINAEDFSESNLQGLTLLGLVCMLDPLRPEVRVAVAQCERAGINVAMVTGDHPATARSIGKELGFVSDGKVITGPELKLAENNQQVDQLVQEGHVFARIEPHQKLDIVRSMQRSGHFVAVSGDGANDAPAIGAAEVGVAMGKSGTDVARETADLIIADDNFASIVAGVEEGRIAYANVRKVIFLLISTGAAELVLFTLALLTGMPLPLLAVQLLWLNLVTNGIQDVALAFEPGEGDELLKQPRSTKEAIFNRLMIERVIVSALVMGIIAFSLFQSLIGLGYSLDAARNSTLLLMVLFENIHVFNCRSENRSIFKHKFLSNPLLLIGTLLAQLIHISAMYLPWISDILRIEPVSLSQWSELLLLAFSVLVVMEIHKYIRNRR